MAPGRGGKIERGVARRAFTLAELVAACAILAILCGCLNLSASSVIARLSGQSSDARVEREVRETAAWIKSHLHRARMLRRDIKLFVPGWLYTDKIRFSDSSDGDECYYLHGEFIVYKAPTSGSGIQINKFVYSYANHTMTPACTLPIFKKTKDGYQMTSWKISISGRGYVTVRQ